VEDERTKLAEELYWILREECDDIALPLLDRKNVLTKLYLFLRAKYAYPN
jgi:hypothetical protein